MPPVAQYVFAETPGISGRFTAGRHECLPYSVFQTFSRQTYKQQATSKNYFLRFWTRDFVSTKVTKSPEYLVYCGLLETLCWSKRSVQNPKG